MRGFYYLEEEKKNNKKCIKKKDLIDMQLNNLSGVCGKKVLKYTAGLCE